MCSPLPWRAADFHISALKRLECCHGVDGDLTLVGQPIQMGVALQRDARRERSVGGLFRRRRTAA
jgi:hypothetical protein